MELVKNNPVTPKCHARKDRRRILDANALGAPFATGGRLNAIGRLQRSYAAFVCLLIAVGAFTGFAAGFAYAASI